MNGADGKPYKTREGGIMKLEDMIATVTAGAQEKLEASSFVDEADYQDIALKVGVAAIKFGDLINQRAKDYVFDLSKFFSFEGKTGPYLLYTITRINSNLEKGRRSGRPAASAHRCLYRFRTGTAFENPSGRRCVPKEPWQRKRQLPV